MAKNTSVMGIYLDRTTAAEAISVLQKEGYRATDISLLSADNQGSKDFALARHSRVADGAAIGTAVGAIVGAALAWFASTQSSSIPVIVALVAGGPVLAAFAGAGLGGVLGWIAGSMAGLPKSRYVAERYAGRIRRGGSLLSVHCDSQEWCNRAKKTLQDTGARDISAASETTADYATTDKPKQRTPAAVTVPSETPNQESKEYAVREIHK